MNSIILQISTKFLQTCFLMCSVYLLSVGHNQPGGGFVGGLIASAAFTLEAIAFDVKSARQLLRIEPHIFSGFGLLIALGSTLFPLILGEAFFADLWFNGHLPIIGDIHIGTAFFFDLGVFCVVLGTSIMIFLQLAEE
jgi:multicomponent Na+:H+ antiporter subunit B